MHSEDVICVLFGLSGAIYFILWVLFYPFIRLLSWFLLAQSEHATIWVVALVLQLPLGVVYLPSSRISGLCKDCLRNSWQKLGGLSTTVAACWFWQPLYKSCIGSRWDRNTGHFGSDSQLWDDQFVPRVDGTMVDYGRNITSCTMHPLDCDEAWFDLFLFIHWS